MPNNFSTRRHELKHKNYYLKLYLDYVQWKSFSYTMQNNILQLYIIISFKDKQLKIILEHPPDIFFFCNKQIP